jgi:sugar (pentulose or hexulose) kinase
MRCFGTGGLGRPGVLLGIDVGTTWVKAAVVTTDGIERSHGRRATRWRRVPTGAEIDPIRFVDDAVDAARDALDAYPEGRAIGIGVTSMAETGVLLDRGGRAVGPAIAWHDERGEEQARALERHFGARTFAERTGRCATRLCSASKLRWLLANHPAARRGVRWLSVAEWVAHALGADQVSELSLASRTGFLDLRARKPWPEMLEGVGAPSSLVADVRPAGAPAGRAGARLPRAADAVVTVAGLDHSVASVGGGAVLSGDVFDSCGTAEALIRAVDPLPAGKQLHEIIGRGVNVDWHVLPERMALIAGLNSGIAMQRILDLLGVAGSGRAELDAAALRLPPGADGVRVLRVLGPDIEIAGIAPGSSPAHVWRATLEALAAAASGVLETIESVSGGPGRIVVAGGGARSYAFRAVKRAVLGPFVEPRVAEAGARGAALFGGLAAGVYSQVGDFPAPEATEWAS